MPVTHLFLQVQWEQQRSLLEKGQVADMHSCLCQIMKRNILNNLENSSNLKMLLDVKIFCVFKYVLLCCV